MRTSPTVYFEWERSEGGRAELVFDAADLAVRPVGIAAFAFADSLALVLPAGLLWSPMVDPERGLWVTLGGGVYGGGIVGDDVLLDDAIGIWGKRRFGCSFWLAAGLAAVHSYDTRAIPKNLVRVIPGIEVGLQLAEPWAATVLADYEYTPLRGGASRARFRAEVVLVPIWWIDLAINGGVYLHERGPLHVDPLVGGTIAARW